MAGAVLKDGARSWNDLHSQGVDAGDPDIVIREWGRLSRAGSRKRGLFMELKRDLRSAQLTSAQRARCGKLRVMGFEVVVVRTVHQAMRVLAQYLPEDWAPTIVADDGEELEDFEATTWLAAANSSGGGTTVVELSSDDEGEEVGEAGGDVTPAPATRLRGWAAVLAEGGGGLRGNMHGNMLFGEEDVWDDHGDVMDALPEFPEYDEREEEQRVREVLWPVRQRARRAHPYTL